MQRCSAMSIYSPEEGQLTTIGSFQGSVTDHNLHLWMYGEDTGSIKTWWNGYMVDPAPVLGAPPMTWEPFKMFPNYEAAVRYIRSEEHTSELQSLMRISYDVFCLKKKINNK